MLGTINRFLRMGRRVVFVLFLCCFLQGFTGWAGVITQQENFLVLYVPFDDSLDAEISRGSKIPLYYDESISFAEGIKGKAVVMKGEGIAYSAPEHINRNRGTIMFWFRGFDPTDLTVRRYARQKMFYEVGKWNETMRLYWPGNGMKMLFYEFICMGSGVNRVSCGFFRPEERWVSPEKQHLRWFSPEKWHHIATTWQNGENAKFYFDGRLVSTTKDIKMPAELSDDFVLGRGTTELQMDELRVYSEPLSADAIQKIYFEADTERRHQQMVVASEKKEKYPTETDLKSSLLSEPWHDNKLGEEDYVPPPWEPVKVQGTKVSTWGATYDCNGILPRTVTLRDGTEMLTAPVSLQMESPDGRKLKLLSGKSAVRERGKGFCILEDTASAENLSFHSKTRIEFDGFIISDIDVEIKKGIRLSKIWLEIPLKREHARYYNICGSRASYLEHFGAPSGRIPEAGMKKSFEPYVWVGDEDRGFAFCTESNLDWINFNTDEVINLFYQKDSLVVRINLCDEETAFEAGQKLSYRFGFLATPSRPFFSGRRLLRIHGLLPAGGADPKQPRRGVEKENILVLLPWRWCTPWKSFHPLAQDTFAKWEERQAELSKRFKKVYTAPYTNFQQLGYQTKGEAEKEWSVKYKDIMAGFPVPSKQFLWYGGTDYWTRSFAFCAGSKAASDFWVWGFNALLERVPTLNGIYIDETYTNYCASDKHGCRDKNIFGEDTGRYPVFAHREMMKRIYIVAKKKDSDFLFWTHDSQFLIPPQRSFSDISTGAEPIVFNTADPLDALSPDRIKAEFLGRQFGVVSLYLPGVIGQDRGKAALGIKEHPDPLLCSERLVHLLFLHDIQIWGIRFLVGSAIEDVWQGSNRYGLDDDAEFIPYWEIERGKRKEVRLPADVDIKVSVYKLANKNLIITVYNTGDKSYNGRINMDWKSLGDERYSEGLKEVISGTRAGKGAVKKIDRKGIEIEIGAKDGMNVGVKLK